MDTIIRPQFAKVFQGYHPKQVEDYISRLESEIEIMDHQEEKNGRESAQLREEVDRLKNQVNIAWSEAETMRSKNSQLNATIRELESALQEQKDAQSRLKLELKMLQESASESDHDPQMIKDAILSAQRMGQIIIQEANQRADAIRTETEEACAAARDKVERMAEERIAEAESHVTAAAVRCEELRQEYNHILVDVSGFKAEVIALYRRHLELLYQLPDNGMFLGAGSDNQLDAESVVSAD